MFTLPATRREDARTEAFVAAIHTSATTVVDEDVRPYAAAVGREPAVLEHPGRRVAVVLVLLLVALGSLLGVVLAGMSAAPELRPAHAVVDLTSDNTSDLEGIARGAR